MTLIDKKDLKEWIENWFTKNKYYHPYSKSNNIPIDELYDILEQMPTIEAEPVRHGEWIYKEYKMANGESIGYFVCSECGHANWLKEDQYCSYCGSRMDLDEVNDEVKDT